MTSKTLRAAVLLSAAAIAALWMNAAVTAATPPKAEAGTKTMPAQATIPAEKTVPVVIGPSFADLAERLLPAVVNVSTTTKIGGDGPALPPMPELPPGSPFEEFFKDFYEQYRNAPQGDQKVSGLGSGFVIDAKQGYIVTNNHVVKDAEEIKVILQDDTTLDATLVGTDEKTDLAVLKVDAAAKLTAVSWGDSDAARVGSWVVAIGNPFGLGGTVTAGIVSARQRDINAGPYDDFIQTDASINRGNSGGPMFNTNGEVVGVNTAIFSPSGGSVGIGFAVPSNLARSVVAQLIKYGQTKRGWLGVRIQEVTPEIAESLGLGKARGALVSSLSPDGPAEKSGIKAGDVILAFNGHDIDHMRQLPRLVADTEVGAKAAVSLFRKGKTANLTVELGQLETAEAALRDENAKPSATTAKGAPETEIGDLGVKLASVNDDLRNVHGIPAGTDGVVVTDVTRGGAAAEKGIIAGDVIIEVDQKAMQTPGDVQKQIEQARKDKRTSILLFVARREDRRFVAIKLK